MSEFEFVQITFAIILGLGVTSVLASIADQLKYRRTKSLYPLQLFAQSVLLLLLFIQLWGFWAARDLEWSIGLFLFHALPPLCFAISAYSSRVDLSASSPTVEEQYFSNKSVVYGFWAMASAFGILLTFFYMRVLDASITEALPLLLLRLTGFLMLMVLLFSRRIPLQWLALLVLMLLSTSILFSFFFELE